jgi:hypothetical protein
MNLGDFLTQNEREFIFSWMPNEDNLNPSPLGSGAQGFRGIMGSTGIMGIMGTTGPTGVQGAQGARGFRGVSGGPTYLPRFGFPDQLNFFISFKEVNDGLYETLEGALHQYKNDVKCKISIEQPVLRWMKNVVMEEHVTRVTEMQIDHYEKRNQINELLSKAEALGANVVEINIQEFHIPPEYITKVEVEEKKPPHASIICHNDSPIYQILKSCGLLEKYCPKFYRNGDPYTFGDIWHRQPEVSI